MKRLLLFIILISGVMSCEKQLPKDEKTSTQEWTDLKKDVMDLRVELCGIQTRNDVTNPMEPLPVIQELRWWKWILVGLADVGGALIGKNASRGQRVGAAIGWSAIAATALDFRLIIPDHNELTDFFYSQTPELTDNGDDDGYYHNLIIHDLWNTYGSDIYSMTQSEIIDKVIIHTEAYFGAGSLSDLRNNKKNYIAKANDFLEVTQTYDTYNSAVIADIKAFMPEEKELWGVVQVYVEGLADVSNKQEYEWYYTSTLEAIDNSSISFANKKDLNSAISVGTASYALWSIDEANSNE